MLFVVVVFSLVFLKTALTSVVQKNMVGRQKVEVEVEQETT